MAKNASSTKQEPAQPITRGDLERNFRALQTGFHDKVEEKKPNAIAIGAAGGLLLLLLVYVLGKRSGKKKSTYVEIRRF
jgi:hypothetical protein